jgi:hypothetical protein
VSLRTRVEALATAVGADVKAILAVQSTTVSLVRMTPGSALTIDYYKDIFGPANSWPAARPTNRDDLDVVWRGPVDPGDTLMRVGDIFDYVEGA